MARQHEGSGHVQNCSKKRRNNQGASLSLMLLVAASGVAAPQTAPPTWLDSALPPEVRAHDLVGRMTLDEKAAQLEDWAPAIPRLGIPDYQTWSEALHGVARAGHATVFPQAIGMAATWDDTIVRGMGQVIATEARAKYNQAQREGNHGIFYGLTFWSPNINIFRDPRWGRGQETYGEDPLLTAIMGVAFIRGVQGDDPLHPQAVATAKHFAVHSGPESLRHEFDVKVSARDLEETYLPAFRAAVVDGHVKSVMCAYNAIDGMSACASPMLLQEHLRDAWGFKGFVVSDCGAIVDVYHGHHNAPDILHAASISLRAGTDLSCSIWAPGFNTLADAVRQGVVSDEMVTRSAERLYTARMQLGMLDPPGSNAGDQIPFSAVASVAHRAIALKAAEESLVLLQNNGILPLQSGARRIAVIGPTAELEASLEGNYNGTSLDAVSPLDGITRQFPDAIVHYAQGAVLADGLGLVVPRTVFGEGLKAEYFATPDWTGRPVAVRRDRTIQHNWGNALPVDELQTHDYSVRWSGTVTVPAPGRYQFQVKSETAFPYSPRETFRLLLDGKVLGEGALNDGKSVPAVGNSASAPPRMSSNNPALITVNFTDMQPHSFQLEYSHAGTRAGGGVSLQWEPPPGVQLDEARAAVKDSDVIIAFVGLSPNLEGEEMPIRIEGFDRGDRTQIDLPASQSKLLESVGASGKPVIVVNLSGSALALTWAQAHAAAVLQAWYPGVEGGTAIAHTLAGTNNPAGRLPVTFYAGLKDLPAFTDYSMQGRTYRYYRGKALWGFGYGLSYSSFRYGAADLSSKSLAAGDTLHAAVAVTNSSNRAGDEVVEAYLKTPQKDGPIYALAAFRRVHLDPGESRRVEFDVDARAMSAVDATGQRSVLAGNYRLSIGSTQPTETRSGVTASYTIHGTKVLEK
jgi:beta-glucosidase